MTVETPDVLEIDPAGAAVGSIAGASATDQLTGDIVEAIRWQAWRVAPGVSRRREGARTDMPRFAMAALVLALGFWSGPASNSVAADRPVPGKCSEAQRAKFGGAYCYFPDVKLRDQDGKEKRLYSDLLKGKIVVISSFFTRCVNICPIVNATLAHLQDELGDHFGTDVHFLSITSDSRHDTSEILAGYARRFEAQAGWHFLTGDEKNVRLANQKLGFAVKKPAQHVNKIYIIDVATGWKKKVSSAVALPKLSRIVKNALRARAEKRRAPP